MPGPIGAQSNEGMFISGQIRSTEADLIWSSRDPNGPIGAQSNEGMFISGQIRSTEGDLIWSSWDPNGPRKRCRYVHPWTQSGNASEAGVFFPELERGTEAKHVH
jgi:hypothetical protein